MRIGLDVAQHQLLWPELVARVQFAEQPWDRVRRRADGLREAGLGYLVAEWPSEGKGRLDEFAEKVLPELQA